jgi:hypothetical protein
MDEFGLRRFRAHYTCWHRNRCRRAINRLANAQVTTRRRAVREIRMLRCDVEGAGNVARSGYLGQLARQSSTLPGKPFFIPSPAIRFAERAEGGKGPKR